MDDDNAQKGIFVLPGRSELCMYGFVLQIAEDWRNAVWASLLQLAEAGHLVLGSRRIEWVGDGGGLFPDEYRLLKSIFGKRLVIVFDIHGNPDSQPPGLDPLLSEVANVRLVTAELLCVKDRISLLERIRIGELVVLTLLGERILCEEFGYEGISVVVTACASLAYISVLRIRPTYCLSPLAKNMQAWIYELNIARAESPKEWMRNLPYMAIFSTPTNLAVSIARVYSGQPIPGWWQSSCISSAQFGVEVVELLAAITGCLRPPKPFGRWRLRRL